MFFKLFCLGYEEEDNLLDTVSSFFAGFIVNSHLFLAAFFFFCSLAIIRLSNFSEVVFFFLSYFP